MRFAVRLALGGLAVVLSFGWAQTGAAQSWDRWLSLSDRIFQPLGMEEGLPNLEIIAIAQDGQGFLWVGSSDGISRWDGYRFRNYRAGPATSGALPDNFVRVLHTDVSGRLWIGTATGGVASYNPQTDRFDTYPVDTGHGLAASGRLEIMALTDDGEGGLWVGGGDGLYRLAANATGQRVVRRDPDRSLPAGRIESLLLDRAGRLWVGTGHGVYCRQPSAPSFRPVALPIPPASLPVVNALMQDQAGRVWIGTNGAGAFVIDGKSDARQIQEPGSLAERVQTLDVESLAEVRPGEIWLGTSGDGIVSVNADTLQTTRIRHDPLRPTSLADDAVWALRKDHAGAIWVGTNRGLGRYDPGQTGILTVFGGTGLRSGIADPDVMSVMAVPDGHVWLGLQRHDIAILDPTGNGTALPHSARLPNAIVTALAQIPGAGAYIATWRGLFRSDFGLQNLQQIRLPGVPENQAVNDLMADGQTLWIGTSDGLFRLDAGTQGEVVVRIPIEDRLTDRRVRVIRPAGPGLLWIGTWDGINLYDTRTGTVRRLRADPADRAALSAGLITSCLTDRDGRLWVATSGGGINIVTGRPGEAGLRIRRIGIADGLPNANVDTLLQAQDGVIWASTDDGLARIDPTNLRITAFHLAEGVAISTYWADSGSVTPEGELLFGGTGGLTVVRPDHLKEVAPNLSIAITDLRIGGKSVAAGRLNGNGPKETVVIDPDANSLAVEFSALHFADPTRYQYAYWLQGVDASWVETDSARRLAAYTNLPPGTMTLQLRVSDLSGGQAPVVMRVPILVLPAWYQTWWFLFVCLVVTVAAVLLLLRLQTAWMKKRQRALERLVNERTVALRRSNEALLHSASTLSDLAEIGQQVTASHDAETILAALHEHVCRLLDARYFAVFLVRGPGQPLILRFGVRDGIRLPPDAPLESWHADEIGRSLRERREVVIELPGTFQPGQAVICHRLYAPLIVLDRVIGVLLIEYEDTKSLAERERMIVRTISAYGAIALDNAEILDQLAQAQSRLELLAFSDGLTNLPNRRVYTEQFERFRMQAIAAGGEFALLLIDLDRFKQINDTYGHDVGDAMLVETAQRLQAAVRGGDMVMRLGGDEFAVLLGDLDGVQSAARICRRIVESFRTEIRVNGVTVEASTSIGVAVFPDDGDTVELLYKAADVALYEAKRSGRNTWRKFEPSLAGTSGDIG